MKTRIYIENLKCGGCESIIRSSLNAVKGVDSAAIDHEEAFVDLEYSGEPVLEEVRKKLRKIGYPEKGSVSGLNKTAANARSYVSCAIGKLSEKKHE